MKSYRLGKTIWKLLPHTTITYKYDIYSVFEGDLLKMGAVPVEEEEVEELVLPPGILKLSSDVKINELVRGFNQLRKDVQKLQNSLTEGE